jgi:hypothetical protein
MLAVAQFGAGELLTTKPRSVIAQTRGMNAPLLGSLAVSEIAGLRVEVAQS